jgi:hypothetical protein
MPESVLIESSLSIGFLSETGEEPQEVKNSAIPAITTIAVEVINLVIKFG